MMQNNKGIIASMIIAVGLFLLGYCVRMGLQNGLSDERYVTVR